MTTGLVLLSEVPVTAGMHHRAYAHLGMMGEMFERLDDQFTTLHGESGRHVLMMHAPMVIHGAQETAAALVGPPEAFGLWSEIMVPPGNTERGHTVAKAMAVEVGGLIRERV